MRERRYPSSPPTCTGVSTRTKRFLCVPTILRALALNISATSASICPGLQTTRGPTWHCTSTEEDQEPYDIRPKAEDAKRTTTGTYVVVGRMFFKVFKLLTHEYNRSLRTSFYWRNFPHQTRRRSWPESFSWHRPKFTTGTLELSSIQLRTKNNLNAFTTGSKTREHVVALRDPERRKYNLVQRRIRLSLLWAKPSCVWSKADWLCDHITAGLLFPK